MSTRPTNRGGESIEQRLKVKKCFILTSMIDEERTVGCEYHRKSQGIAERGASGVNQKKGAEGIREGER